MSGLPNLNDDLSELIGLFRSHRVDFMVVGAHALALYGVPRFTQDLDLFVARTRENAIRVVNALRDFGISAPDDVVEQLCNNPRAMLSLGNKPNQVEILNFLDGVEFEDASTRTLIASMGGHEVHFIGFTDYVATKRAAGRAKDLDDLARLRELGHVV